MKFQLRGKKFFTVVVLLSSFAIVSLKIISTMLSMDSSEDQEVTFRLIWFSDYDRSDITKTSKKSIELIENSSVSKLQKANLENVKAASLPPPDHNTEYSKAHVLKGSGGCIIPPRGFKSWTKGTVTQVNPVIHANCTLLFKGGDELEVAQVQFASYTWPAKEHALKFAKWVKTHSCIHFKDELEDNVYTTKDEIEFPLAFTMVVHNNTFQVYRLLKVLYRPHNIYCIHYDSRSSVDMKLLFKKLAMCFDNIITPSSIGEVQWGHHSLMDAQMNCFKDLLRRHHKYPWRYVITLCGKELPLRTNGEIVQVLKRLKGNSAIHASPIPKKEQMRYKVKWTLDKNMSVLVPTKNDTGPIPYNLTIYKSMIYFALTPEFVNYTLNDEVAITLSEFLKDALIPEETFYGTLFMIPGVPGGYNANVSSLIPVVSTYIWITQPAQKKEPYKYCRSGYIVHEICIMTSADLHTVSSNMNFINFTGPMFLNKYFMEKDHTVMDCVEEQLIIRNRLEYKKDCLA